MNPRIVKSREKDLQVSEFGQHRWMLAVDNDTVLADILKPVFWSEIKHRLRAGNLVDVVTRDFSFETTVRVTKIELGLVHTRLQYPGMVFEHADRGLMLAAATSGDDTAALQVPEGYKVKSTPKANGGAGGHYVQNGATGEKIGQTFETRPQAIRFAIEHARMAGTLPAAEPAPEPEQQVA